MAESQSTRTVCAGRLLLGVPRDTEMRLNAEYRSSEVRQVGYANNFAEIEREIQQRAATLSNEKMSKGSTPLERRLEREGRLKRGSSRLVGMDVYTSQSYIVIGTHKDDSDPEILVELHKLTNGKRYRFSRTNLGNDKYSTARDSLIETSHRFTPFQRNEIPQQPGFCVASGIFIDQGRPDANETFTLALEFPQHADVRFSIESIAIDAPDNEESLEQRAQADLANMRSQVGQVDVISRGKKSVAGQPGYEIAISAPTENGKLRKFFWGAEGVPNDVTRPFLEIDMMIEPSDGHPATFKSDAEAKAFWDSLLNSLQIRPGAA